MTECRMVVDYSPVLGPKMENNKQKISLYDSSGIRRTLVVDADKADEYLSARKSTDKKSFAAGLLATVGSVAAGVFAGGKLTQDNFFRSTNKGLGGMIGLTVGLLGTALARKILSDKLTDKFIEENK